jgi:hypothetical protein
MHSIESLAVNACTIQGVTKRSSMIIIHFQNFFVIGDTYIDCLNLLIKVTIRTYVS